jgi:hypothetical protein
MKSILKRCHRSDQTPTKCRLGGGQRGVSCFLSSRVLSFCDSGLDRDGNRGRSRVGQPGGLKVQRFRKGEFSLEQDRPTAL